MKVAIIKYNAGNIYSVVNALRRLGVEPVITDDPQELSAADRIIFPVRAVRRPRWPTCVRMAWMKSSAL